MSLLELIQLILHRRMARMTPPALISVINSGKVIADSDLVKMVEAQGIQNARDVSPLYGLVPAIEFVQEGGSPSPGGVPCYIEAHSDVEGALGYHDEDSNGVPYIKVFAQTIFDSGGSVMSGANSVSVTISHEVLELTGDSPANKWVDGPDGNDFALELCDAVEGDSYDITLADGSTVAVSNFVLQAFFDPKAEKGSKYDFLGKLSRPFSMTAGGYQITRTEPGKVSQVFAHLADGSLSQVAAHSLCAAGAHQSVAVQQLAVQLKPGIHVHFGPSVSEKTKQGKLRKILRRRGKS